MYLRKNTKLSLITVDYINIFPYHLPITLTCNQRYWLYQVYTSVYKENQTLIFKAMFTHQFLTLFWTQHNQDEDSLKSEYRTDIPYINSYSACVLQSQSNVLPTQNMDC